MITILDLLRNRGVISGLVAVVATLANLLGLDNLIPDQQALAEGLLQLTVAVAAVVAVFSVKPGDEQK